MYLGIVSAFPIHSFSLHKKCKLLEAHVSLAHKHVVSQVIQKRSNEPRHMLKTIHKHIPGKKHSKEERRLE